MDHGILLPILFGLRRIQFLLCLRDLFFFGSDLALQVCNILFDLTQILIQLSHVAFEVTFLGLQILLDLFQVAQVALHRFAFFLCLIDLILFLPDAV